MGINKKVYKMANMKSLDTDKRQVEWIISTGSLDRDFDRLNPSGCEHENYDKNPVVLVDHNWTTDSIVARNIAIKVSENEIIATTQFPPLGELPLSDEIFKKIENKLINAVSVGFRTKEYGRNDEGGYDINLWELLEYSFVAIPANPEALIKGEKEVDEVDEPKVQELINAAVTPLQEKITELETKITDIEVALEDADIEAEISAEETE